jgi:hypothetical protein
VNQNDNNTGRTSKGGSEESNKKQTNTGNEVNRRAFLGAGSLGTAAFAALGRAADVFRIAAKRLAGSPAT